MESINVCQILVKKLKIVIWNIVFDRNDTFKNIFVLEDGHWPIHGYQFAAAFV